MTIGVVLAGGVSARFGGRPKGLQLFRGRAMALCVADTLAHVCDRVLIEAPAGTGYEGLGLPLIHASPEHAGKGPLAGIVAGLASAPEGSRVVFAPCDMPLLDDAVFRALMRGGSSTYALSPHGAEALVVVLDRALLRPLLATLAAEKIPRTDAALVAAGARGLTFADATAFANVNTPDDLARLE